MSASAGGGVVTEMIAAAKSEEFRAVQPHFVSLSFPTIAGYAANGAIIHYRVRLSCEQCSH
jgi:Xaa-Pro aminopeptidase